MPPRLPVGCELRTRRGLTDSFQAVVDGLYCDQWGQRERRHCLHTGLSQESREEDEEERKSDLTPPVSLLSEPLSSVFAKELVACARCGEVEDVGDMVMGEDDAEGSDIALVSLDLEESDVENIVDGAQYIWQTLGCKTEIVPRMGGLCDDTVRACSHRGEAVVATSEELLGFESPLLSWDCAYLQQHLPADQQFGVAHGARRIARGAALFSEAAAEIARGPAEDVTRAEIWLLWRRCDGDHGELGPIGEHLTKDLRTVNFWMFKLWQMEDEHPILQSCRLHVGGCGATIPCEYSLQPRTFVQLVGQSKVVMFPPESWDLLYPAPSFSALDGLSLIGEGEGFDTERFPKASRARPSVAELAPGDAVQVPAFWWLQLQAENSTSSVLELDFFPAGVKAPDTAYGVSPRCDGLRLVRDVEWQVARDLGPYASSKKRALHAYMRTTSQQLGCLVGWDGTDVLESLHAAPKKVLEALDAELRKLVGARLMAKDADIDPEKWLLRMIEGRF